MTAAPIRVRLSRAKGWRMPAGVVKVDRSTRWGNPFNFKSSDHCWMALSWGCRADPAGRHAASVLAFRAWITPRARGRLVSSERGVMMKAGGQEVALGPVVAVGAPPTLDEIQAALRGKNLACWCALPAPGEPDICHAAVLLEIANADDPEPLPEPLPPKTEGA